MGTKITKEQTIDTLNAIRAEASQGFQRGVPRVTNDIATLRAFGQALRDRTDWHNEFVSTLYNRIIETIVANRPYTNPLKQFKKGTLEYGDTIEQYFVKLATPRQFNQEKAETELYKRVLPEVLTAFHVRNYKIMYKVTSSEELTRPAFLSWEGLGRFIEEEVQRLHDAMEYDEQLATMYMIKRAYLDGKLKSQEIETLTSGDNVKAAMRKVKEHSMNMNFMRKDYNETGVRTSTPQENKVILISTYANAAVDTEVLASAFQLPYADFLERRVLIDTFADDDSERLAEIFPDATPFTPTEKERLRNLNLMVVDIDWFMIFDNLTRMGTTPNEEGLYNNHVLHAWRTFSYSPFHNALAFTSTFNGVTGITVTPENQEITKNSSHQFTATVTTAGNVSKQVSYNLIGDFTSANTTVTPEGLVKIGADETATTAILRAIAVADTRYFADADITIK